MPISSNITESLGNDPSVFHSCGVFPLNSTVSTHGNDPSISNTFVRNIFNGNALSTSTNCLNNSVNGKAPNSSNNENVLNSNEMLHYHHLKYKKETHKN